jgi:ribosomal protein L11 methylase PrmA
MNVIEPMLQGLNELLNPGGTVILSGLLQADRRQILRALIGSTLTVREELAENEWLAVVAGTR